MKRAVVILAVLICFCTGVAGFFTAATLVGELRKPAVDRPETWAAKRTALESRFDGFVIWESRRGDDWQLRRYGAAWNPLSWRWVKESPRWRLWICELNGSAPRPLTEPGLDRDHFAPHISPDGKSVAYLSYPAGKDGYMPPGEDWTAELRLLQLGTGRDEVLVPSARTFGEHRAVTWIDPARLAYIDGDGVTQLMDLQTGESTPLLDWNGQAAGMDFEYGWLPGPSLEFATTGRPRFAEILQDSASTRPRTAVRNGCQPYFTADNLWGYFMEWAGGPRISRVHLATRTVTPLTQVRDERMPPEKNYTYFPMVSRNQEVMAFAASSGGHDHFLEDYDIFLVPLDPAGLHWTGAPVRYTFHPQTDRYPDVFIEDVQVAAAAVPQPEAFLAMEEGMVTLGATVAMDADSVRVIADFEMATGGIDARHDGRELRFSLAQAPDAEGIVQVTVNALDGRELPEQSLRISTRKWPVSMDGLVFHWKTNDVEPQDFMDRTGAAMWDRNGAMQLRGGTFTARGSTPQTLQPAGLPFALEFAVRGYESSAAPPVTIFSMGENIQLVQDGRSASLVTGRGPAIPLFDIDPRQPDHIVLQFQAESMKCFVNGEKTADHQWTTGVSWTSGLLVFGSGWHGSIEQVAFYHRLLTPEEIAFAAVRLRESLDPRAVTARSVVSARLLQRSPTPALESIAPYRDALATFEAEVLTELEGASMPAGSVFRFHAPVILDRKPTPVSAAVPGNILELLLEPLALNAQAEEIFVSDELAIDSVAEEYFSLYERLEPAPSAE